MARYCQHDWAVSLTTSGLQMLAPVELKDSAEVSATVSMKSTCEGSSCFIAIRKWVAAKLPCSHQSQVASQALVTHRVHLPGLPLPMTPFWPLPNCCSHLPARWCFKVACLPAASQSNGMRRPPPLHLHVALTSLKTSLLFTVERASERKQPYLRPLYMLSYQPIHFLEGLKRLDIAFISPIMSPLHIHLAWRSTPSTAQWSMSVFS